MATRTKAAPEQKAAAPAKATIVEGQSVVLYESAPDTRGEVFRATLNRFKGKTYCRLGKWYRGETVPGQEEWKPGKGISVPFDSEGVMMLKNGAVALQESLARYDA